MQERVALAWLVPAVLTGCLRGRDRSGFPRSDRSSKSFSPQRSRISNGGRGRVSFGGCELLPARRSAVTSCPLKIRLAFHEDRRSIKPWVLGCCRADNSVVVDAVAGIKPDIQHDADVGNRCPAVSHGVV